MGNANLTDKFSEVTDLIKFLDIWYAFWYIEIFY
jgi:hypothetical protein